MAIEIVSFPIKNGDVNHTSSYLDLPEGKPPFSHGFPTGFPHNMVSYGFPKGFPDKNGDSHPALVVLSPFVKLPGPGSSARRQQCSGSPCLSLLGAAASSGQRWGMGDASLEIMVLDREIIPFYGRKIILLVNY